MWYPGMYIGAFVDWLLDLDYKWWRKWIGEKPLNGRGEPWEPGDTL